MTTKIHTKVMGQGKPVALLHGLFGQGSNLQTVATALADEYQVLLLDLPNHGRSEWTDRTDLASMAESISAALDEQGVDELALVGHSLGGKVAMQLALSRGERVAALAVADIAPVTYAERRHDHIFEGLHAVAEMAPRSRREAIDTLLEHVDEQGVAEFLALSLERDERKNYSRWRFNVDALERGYQHVLAAPGDASTRAYEGAVLFIKGALSDYLRGEHQGEVQALFPKAQVKVMADCGHWLHAQQPRLFNNIVRRFLTRHYPV